LEDLFAFLLSIKRSCSFANPQGGDTSDEILIHAAHLARLSWVARAEAGRTPGDPQQQGEPHHVASVLFATDFACMQSLTA
jgi:hypothetical protein